MIKIPQAGSVLYRSIANVRIGIFALRIHSELFFAQWLIIFKVHLCKENLFKEQL